MKNSRAITLEGIHCELSIERPRSGMVILRLRGHDVGEFGAAPLRELDADVSRGDLELFIDAREALGPSTDVSAQWAAWLRANRERFRRVSMLTGSRFVQLTAEFVRRYGELGERMCIFTDPTAFDTAVSLAIAPR